MDIKNLSNHIDRQLNNTNKLSEQAQKVQSGSTKSADSDISDKVSVNSSFKSKKSEELFAKIELEKLKSGSFEKLKEMKARLSEYEAAKANSPEEAKKTEIGKLLDNPEVWEQIAQKITGQ